MLRIIFFIISLLYLSKSYALQSDWGGLEEAKVRIISPITQAGESKDIFLGLEYELKEGWKTYWHTPGDGGFPQSLDWKKSINIDSLELLWPQPVQFEILGMKSIGYKNEVVFPLKIKLKNRKKKSTFFFELNYLTCKDICIPGKANLELILPPGQGRLTDNFYKIEKFLSKIPFKKNEIVGLGISNITAEYNNNISSITFDAHSKKPLLKPKFFLGNSLGLPIVDPIYSFSNDRKNVKVKFLYKDISFQDKNLDLSVFFIDRDVSIEYQEAVQAYPVTKVKQFDYFFLYIVLVSLLGGLILNAMPCVLPVLSLKLLSVLKFQNQDSFHSIRYSFFSTAIGIIISFVLLSFVLIILKSIGISIGWGIQFQQPLFLMFISLVLFLFSLNLIGVFKFYLPSFLYNAPLIKNNNKSLYNDFFNGFFATLLATPCSAPFVGTAVSVAFTQSYMILISIFFFMGLGMSTPYLIAGIFPKIVSLLPKPGQWMIQLKYFLAFLLLLTIFWLGNILLNHFNYFFILISIFLSLIVFFSFRYYNKFSIVTFFLSIFIFISLNFIPQLQVNNISNENNWLNLDNVSIQDLVYDDKIVFVDITADWCATCQFNKFNVINSKFIQNSFKENNIIQVRGDWTKPNKNIEQYLNNFKRFGIPFNVMYSEYYPEGVILSELLTIDEIVTTIDKLKKINNDFN